jgi:hypothetical protein
VGPATGFGSDFIGVIGGMLLLELAGLSVSRGLFFLDFCGVVKSSYPLKKQRQRQRE